MRRLLPYYAAIAAAGLALVLCYCLLDSLLDSRSVKANPLPQKADSPSEKVPTLPEKVNPKHEASPSGIIEKEVPADVPRFGRKYAATLERGITLTVKAEWFLGKRWLRGELTQSDGKWALFDPEDPADKILDRELLPSVQRWCKEIVALDMAYADSDPKEFTDEAGHVWHRAEKASR